MSSWMVYATAVSLVCLIGVFAAHAALTRLGRPTRGAWAAGMVAAWLIPLAQVALSRLGMPPVRSVIWLEPMRVGEVGAAVTEAMGYDLDVLLTVAWIVGTAAMMLVAGASVVRIRSVRRTLEARTVRGVPVLVSPTLGPAVLGVARPKIVLPSWALEVGPDTLMILVHERQHVAASDTRLLAGAYTLLAFVPWNPVMWYLYRRLRLAVEFDCDARVLDSSRVPIRTYCELLLSVSTRATWTTPAVAALAEPKSFLERRIDRMTLKRGSAKPLILVGLCGIAGLAMTAAWLFPGPGTVVTQNDILPRVGVESETPETEPHAAMPPSQAATDLSDGPTFTPYTVAPSLANRTEIQAALQREYPPLLQDAGIGGTVNVWFFLDADGVLRDVRIMESSGHPALDGAALDVARAMRFEPALNRDQPVPVWVAFPISFQPPNVSERPKHD